MGNAWEQFNKLADKKNSDRSGGDSLSYQVWVPPALLSLLLYVAFILPMGYRQGLRGCDLAIQTQQPCL